MISWWGWSDANRARASPALMVAIARRLVTCVDAPLLGRLEEDERGAMMERKPILAVEAARVVVWWWVGLETAWRASLRRTLADAMVMRGWGVLILGASLFGVLIWFWWCGVAGNILFSRTLRKRKTEPLLWGRVLAVLLLVPFSFLHWQHPSKQK